MKKFLLLILLSPLSFGQDKNTSTEFNLSCKVTGQAYLETKDGKSKIYSDYKYGLKNGDVFGIKFIFRSNRDSGNYSLIIATDKVNIDNYVVGYLGNVSSEFELRGLNFVDSVNGGKHHLDDDGVIINNNDIYTANHLRLKRYHENDYELKISDASRIGFPSSTITANCMNMPSEYDEIISIIKTIDKDKWGNYQ